MRMGAFLVGGILGAAAAVYVQKNNNRTTMLAQAGQSVNRVLSNAKTILFSTGSEMMGANTNASMNTSTNASTNTSTSTSCSTSANSDTSLNKVEQIVNEDPVLRAEVDKILTEDTYANAGQH